MYTYQWDEQTGGYVLLTAHLNFSKEPRPVYYQELDILGFDKKGWNYAKDDSYPYMWAESNSYYYRGKLVAKTRGGSLYTKPEVAILQEPEVDGQPLKFVDLKTMIEKNSEIMETLVNQTIKRVYNTYVEYQDKVDVFYVAFSGGKDSVVLLDIVQKALPHNAFKVVFGDTQMENEDTYDIINYTKTYCNEQGIDFLWAKSHLKPSSSWSIFGYPSSKLRWCCSVHKTTPQILEIRKSINKNDFKGMAFVGVRKDESIERSQYSTISEGEKHQGQYSFNAIDNWNSAELFLYIFAENIKLNRSYLKGNSRVGCLVCPMSSGKHEYVKRACYQKPVDTFINLIKTKSNRKFDDSAKETDFIENGGWKVRNNGRDLKVPISKYDEQFFNNQLIISVGKNDIWKEWMKTIGVLLYCDKGNEYKIQHYEGDKLLDVYDFSVRDTGENLVFSIFGKPKTKQDIHFLSLFRSVLKKSAYCIKCKACQSDCIHGSINMDSKLTISNCVRCHRCHNIDSGCLVYNSIKILKGVEKNMSLDSYASFGVEYDWVKKYMKFKEVFWTSAENGLGSMKITALKRFLRDAKIKLEATDSNPIAVKLHSLYDSQKICEDVFWSILLANLAYAPQINWFIKNLTLDEIYLVDEIKEKIGERQTAGGKGNIVSSIKNLLTKTPLGLSLNFGDCTFKGKETISIQRTQVKSVDSRVLLYSLYKFAESLDQYQFTLSRVMDFVIESDAVSPAEIFGLDRNGFERILNGLSINYPEFISASFTLNLDNITLRSEKTAFDVLNLFEEEQ